MRPSPAGGTGVGGEGRIRARARKLRQAMTDAESRLVYHLCAHRLAGIKFKRQVPVGPCIVDFASVERLLVVEADGSQHLDSGRDIERDAYLRDQGFTILRFWNDDILLRPPAGLEEILRNAGPLPQPLSRARERAVRP